MEKRTGKKFPDGFYIATLKSGKRVRCLLKKGAGIIREDIYTFSDDFSSIRDLEEVPCEIE